MIIEEQDYILCRAEIYSYLEQQKDILFFISRTNTKYKGQDWIINWLIKKIHENLKNDENRALKIISIIEKAGFNTGHKQIIDEAIQRLVEEKIYNEKDEDIYIVPENKLDYEKDVYDF